MSIYHSSGNYPSSEENHNEYGFRELRPYKKNQALAFGSSFTYGDCLPPEQAWPHHLEQMLPNIEVYNFGVKGGSFDSTVRLAESWVTKLNPEYVFVELLFKDRFEFYHDGGWRRILPNIPNDVDLPKDIFSVEQTTVNYVKNMHALQSICSKTKLVIKQSLPSYTQFASDNMHPGPIWHNKTAELFYKELEDLFS